jgi:peptidoglycan hydrolase-like protein with peptidoglycan-binding domain/DNA invertase Pin-like site-specific DNA recombinase
MACLAVLCVPAWSIAADPSGSTAGAADRPNALLARGAGYGQPQGEPRVRALQSMLRARGQRPGPVDGLYGPLTEAAVERLQRDRGLAVDGIVGAQTRRVLSAKTPRLALGAGYVQPGGSPQVRATQRRLRVLGQRPGPVDGLYGPRTQGAIERFQRTTGQPASGVLSPATAAALARTDSDQPSRPASDTRSGSEPRQRGRRPAIRAESSGADDRRHRADRSRPAGGSDQSRIPTAKAADDRTKGTDGAESTSPVPLALLALSLAAIGGLLVGRLKGRPRTPEASGVLGGPVRHGPMPNGGRKAAKPSAVSTAPSSTWPGRRRRGPAAIGYVSVREHEAVDGQELRDQMAAIDTACRQRGLVLEDVIRDLEQVNDAGPERRGTKYALRRLAAGEASCLVVAELGRLSRSAPEVGYIVGWLRRREARLVAVDDGLDTGTKRGGEAADKLVSLSASDAQRRPSVRIGRPGAVPEQRPIERASGSSRPARDEVPELKQRIRALRASGMTLQAIADRLNAEKVPTLRGGAKWRPSGVQAATGYRRPRPGATASGNGGERAGNGSSGRRGRSRRPASSRNGGGTR